MSVRTYSYGQPLAIYIRAPEFLIYARNRRSVYEFVTRHVLPNSSRDETESLGKELERHEQNVGLLWLVDDLDRLPEADQSEVVMQLALVPTVLYAACPWEADRLAHQIYQPHVGVFELKDLSKEKQKEILTQLFVQYSETPINKPLGYLALAEVPYLARLPLGIMTVFDQLLAGDADRDHVTNRALGEYFERVGLPRPQFAGDWWSLDPTVRALLVMATVTGADILWVEKANLFANRTRFEQGAGWSREINWELLAKTRLFQPHPQRGEACRFYNWDILGYLIAKSAVASLYSHECLTPTDISTPFSEAVSHFQLYVEAWYSTQVE